MKTSTEITKITTDFLKAQKKITVAVKNATNPYFKSKYADLASVIEACKEELNNNGIVILQPINVIDLTGHSEVETILVHTSGEWFSSTTPIICKVQNDPQALGSAISYARRYGLQSMVLLPAEDDDGNSATDKKEVDPTDAWPDNNNLADKPTGKQEHFCTIHNKPMKERIAKNGGKYYDHRWQDEANVWQKCNGEVIKSDK